MVDIGWHWLTLVDIGWHVNIAWPDLCREVWHGCCGWAPSDCNSVWKAKHCTDSTRFSMRAWLQMYMYNIYSYRYDQTVSDCCINAFLSWMREHRRRSRLVQLKKSSKYTLRISMKSELFSSLRGLALAACELRSGVGLQLEKRLSHAIPRPRHDVCRRAWQGWVRQLRHWHDQQD